MRAKVSVGGLCFLLLVGLTIYWNLPQTSEALQHLGQGEPPKDDEVQPPEDETPSETSQQGDPPTQGSTLQGLASSAPECGILIKADGGVEPPWAPIWREGGTYTLFEDIYMGVELCPECGTTRCNPGYCDTCGEPYFSPGSICVLSDNIVIDGTGHAITGGRNNRDPGLVLYGVRNVTLKNLYLTGLDHGVHLVNSDDCILANSTIQGNRKTYVGPSVISTGVLLRRTNGITLKNVEIKNFGIGVLICSSNKSVLIGNLISDNSAHGISIDPVETGYGMTPPDIPCDPLGGASSHSNLLVGNTISSNRHSGISISEDYAGSTIYHNNFINNTYQITRSGPQATRASWDNGPVSGGNYWDDYAGLDIDRDGMGDTPYSIWPRDRANRDKYPLMKPWTGVLEPALLPLLTILGLILLPALLHKYVGHID